LLSIYTPLKVFHYHEKLYSLPKEKKEILAPIHIRIKPTNRCNHNCRYCAYRVENLQLGKDMSKNHVIDREKMSELIKDIIEMKVKSVTFSGGGEPLIYPYLSDSIRKLADSPIKFSALSNGSNLKGELAHLFANYATWIRISMDGWDDKSYCNYRNVRDGEYTLILKNMETFKSLNGKCILGVSLIIDNENYDKIYQQVKRLKELGVDNVKISPCIVSNNGKLNNLFHRDFFDEAKYETQKAKDGLEDESFEVYDSYHELDKKFIKAYTWCPYQQVLSVIGADLNIYTCQDKAYNMEKGLIGSIKNMRFKDFWFKDKSNFFKIDPSKDCNHHCVANHKNELVLNFLNCNPEHMSFV